MFGGHRPTARGGGLLTMVWSFGGSQWSHCAWLFGTPLKRAGISLTKSHKVNVDSQSLMAHGPERRGEQVVQGLCIYCCVPCFFCVLTCSSCSVRSRGVPSPCGSGHKYAIAYLTPPNFPQTFRHFLTIQSMSKNVCLVLSYILSHFSQIGQTLAKLCYFYWKRMCKFVLLMQLIVYDVNNTTEMTPDTKPESKHKYTEWRSCLFHLGWLLVRCSLVHFNSIVPRWWVPSLLNKSRSWGQTNHYFATLIHVKLNNQECVYCIVFFASRLLFSCAYHRRSLCDWSGDRSC
jgi:hypothetical protein